MEDENKGKNQESSNLNDGNSEDLSIPPSPLSNITPGTKKFYVILPVLILIVILTVVSINKYHSANQETEMPIQNEINTIDCELSGQKKGEERELYEPLEKPGSFGEGSEESKIIARLLKYDPLVIEPLDMDPWPGSQKRLPGIEDTFLIREDSFDELYNLTFNDIFEAKLYNYPIWGEELGIGTGLYDIKKINGSPDYYREDLSQLQNSNRSGILIRYRSLESEVLIIYRDGAVYYKDKDGNWLANQKLSDTQINNLLKGFEKMNFDALPSEDHFVQYQPSVALICNRYQNVLIEENTDSEPKQPFAGYDPSKFQRFDLSQITSELEKVIDGLQTNFELLITFVEKKKVQVFDWPMIDYPLSQVNKYHDDALAIYRNTGIVQKNHPAYTEVPEEVLSTLSPTANAYYNSEGKTYLVGTGHGCLSTSQVCKDGTLYMIGTKELSEPVDDLGGIYLWPSSLGVHLKDITKAGYILPQETYEQNRTFFDKLGEAWGGGTFLEDGYLYTAVKLRRNERE